MPSTYTPSDTFKEGSEKEWPSKLGALDWDSTRIVFTKRTLIEFLRYTGTSADPNLHNIAKLPRYADFGRFEDDGEAAHAVPGITKTTSAGTVAAPSDDFKPSRRVRTVPGGAQTFTLGDGSDDAFEPILSKHTESLSISNEQADKNSEGDNNIQSSEAEFRPSRRVRTGPGGPSSMANLWDDHNEPESFKPTRRVREGPGGADSISQIF